MVKSRFVAQYEGPQKTSKEVMSLHMTFFQFLKKPHITLKSLFIVIQIQFESQALFESQYPKKSQNQNFSDYHLTLHSNAVRSKNKDYIKMAVLTYRVEFSDSQENLKLLVKVIRNKTKFGLPFFE